VGTAVVCTDSDATCFFRHKSDQCSQTLQVCGLDLDLDHEGSVKPAIWALYGMFNN